jgi:hypothetical protein
MVPQQTVIEDEDDDEYENEERTYEAKISRLKT